MNKGGLFGTVGLLVMLLIGIVIWQHGQLSSAAQAATAVEARNTELQKKVESLEQEVTALKETADYYFQNGVNQQTAGNFQEAKTTFEAVIAKFPTSTLVGSARQRLAAVKEAIAKAEADRAAEMQRQQEEQEKQAQELGEPIDFATLKAKIMAGTIEQRKRYRFEARLEQDLTGIAKPDGPSSDWVRSKAYYLNGRPQEKEVIMKQLAEKFDSVCTIVGSWGGALYSNQFVITDIENCH